MPLLVLLKRKIMKPCEIVDSLDKSLDHFYMVDTPFGKNKLMFLRHHYGDNIWILCETWDTGWWTIEKNPNNYINTNYDIKDFVKSNKE
jgi:hypothetical protein